MMITLSVVVEQSCVKKVNFRQEEKMDYEKEIRENWFKDHEATIEHHNENLTTITWRKKGTSIYYISYIIRYNTLFVTGDVGDAVYGWPDRISLEWLAGCDIHYFNGKCAASESGRGYKDWDSKIAEKEWKRQVEERFEELKDNIAYDRSIDNDEEENKRLAHVEELYEEHESLLEHATSSIDSLQEWVHFMVEEQNTLYEIFGDDWASGLSTIGEVIDNRCLSHLIGLKMIQEKLNKE